MYQSGLFETKVNAKKTDVIYQPKGRAAEYCHWACNIYRGCEHGCRYCYVPAIMRSSLDSFSVMAEPRKDILEKLEQDAAYQSNNGLDENILLSFTSDAYQPIEQKIGITRKALEILAKYGLKVTVLTKGGSRALRDIDLYQDGWEFASTLTFIDDYDSLIWEKGAALPKDRINTLKEFHGHGIYTWVSLEPVIDVEQTLELIDITHEFVDKYKVGKLNYRDEARSIDWASFGKQAVEKLRGYGKDYYLKNDLRMYLN